MAKGRKQIPQSTKVTRGTFRHDRANDCAPNQAPDGMRAPVWLPVEAIEYFGVLKTRVEEYGLNSSSYTETLALAAMRLSEIDELTKLIETEAPVYETVNKQGARIKKGHPAVAQRSEAARHLQSLLAEFGLTPATINKVSKPGGKGKVNRFGQLG